MKKSVKIALATSALAVAGGLFLVGSSFADRMGPGGMGPGGMGPMGGPMGGFGEMRREMLKEIDTNGDGAISQDEINVAIDARFAEFDADKNGSLSLSEFEALWAEITKPMAVRTFQFLDPNGDAEISKAELNDRFGNIVAHFDRNHDGMLSPDDRPHHRGPAATAARATAARVDGGTTAPTTKGRTTTAGRTTSNGNRGTRPQLRPPLRRETRETEAPERLASGLPDESARVLRWRQSRPRAGALPLRF